MEGHRHVGLLESGPYGVVVGDPRRLVSVSGGHGTRHHHHEARPRGEYPVDLGDGLGRVGEGEHRGGEQAAIAVEPPVLVQPQVEGPEGGVQGRQVMAEGLLHADAEGGKQERTLEALSVHQGQAGIPIPVAGVVGEGLEVAEHGGHVAALGVAPPEVVLEAARAGDRVEGGVRDELVDPATDQQALPAVDHGPLHAALRHGRVDVAGEGVLGLVVVVVGVEGPEVRS